MALTTFVSQNLGAKQYDRAKKGARFGILCSVIIAELIGFVIYAAAPTLIAAFNSDPQVVHYGVMPVSYTHLDVYKRQWLDEGFDNYAAVTFQNAKDVLMMGWGMNWQYAAQTPTEDYCGQATLARKLSLTKVDGDLTLVAARCV